MARRSFPGMLFLYYSLETSTVAEGGGNNYCNPSASYGLRLSEFQVACSPFLPGGLTISPLSPWLALYFISQLKNLGPSRPITSVYLLVTVRTVIVDETTSRAVN